MKYLRNALITIFMIFIFYGCSSLFNERDVDFVSHPPVIKARLLCTDCHEGESETFGKTFKNFNHTLRFVDQHGIYVSHDNEICSFCHQENFCADCHSVRNTVPANLKKGNRTDKVYPHKDNYLIKHRFEGKNMPERCFKCHGRKNNRKCNNCHKR